jgi:hypothetical protein
MRDQKGVSWCTYGMPRKIPDLRAATFDFLCLNIFHKYVIQAIMGGGWVLISA